MRDLGKSSNQDHQWEVAYSFFPEFSFDAIVGSCEEGLKLCVCEGRRRMNQEEQDGCGVSPVFWDCGGLCTRPWFSRFTS